MIFDLPQTTRSAPHQIFPAYNLLQTQNRLSAMRPYWTTMVMSTMSIPLHRQVNNKRKREKKEHAVDAPPVACKIRQTPSAFFKLSYTFESWCVIHDKCVDFTQLRLWIQEMQYISWDAWSRPGRFCVYRTILFRGGQKSLNLLWKLAWEPHSTGI